MIRYLSGVKREDIFKEKIYLLLALEIKDILQMWKKKQLITIETMT